MTIFCKVIIADGTMVRFYNMLCLFMNVLCSTCILVMMKNFYHMYEKENHQQKQRCQFTFPYSSSSFHVAKIREKFFFAILLQKRCSFKFMDTRDFPFWYSCAISAVMQ
jgi:hypothetical protein